MLHRPFYRFIGKLLKKYDRRKLAVKILLHEDFDYSIKNAAFVNSRSILFACDIHPNDPQSSRINSAYLKSIPARVNAFRDKHPDFETLSIYVPSDGLFYFAEQVLPKINASFTLVSGDSDLPIDQSTLRNSLDILLTNTHLKKWFAQNRNVDHPKLHFLPIGINIHNLWSDPLQWGGGFILPSMQELQLKTIAQNAPPFSSRIPNVFCNWYFSIDRSDRKQCLKQIDHSICYFQPEPAPMTNTWELQSQYQFVLSPHGAGLDCHRTWEALLLGCIPIVKSANINGMFDGLPVLSVSEWSQVSPSFLENALREIEVREINTEKLLMRYWASKIKGAH